MIKDVILKRFEELQAQSNTLPFRPDPDTSSLYVPAGLAGMGH
jgi:hypothetical protein